MLKKYLLLLIIITIAVSMATNTMAADYNYYVTLSISAFATNDGGVTTLLIEQNAASPVTYKIEDSGATEIYSSGALTASRTYGAADDIVVGPLSMTQDETHKFTLNFDEVRVGSNYYGSCTTNSGSLSACRNCAGASASCVAQGREPVPGNGYAPYANTAGDTAACDGGSRGVACTSLIANALDEGSSVTYSLSFTPS